ncbi:MAG: MlaD family protein, partial [Treponema sp.]|nr:MlaD family protein [Treponema sp.]
MMFSRYAKIAFFFIVVGSAGCVYIIASANGMNDFNSNEYEAVLGDATGLSTRSKMYLAGVVVGRVKAISLVDNEAVLRLSILKKIKVYDDAVISRKSSSILGTAILNLHPGSEARPPLTVGGRISTLRDTGDMNALLGTAQDLGGQISGLLKDFQENQLALLSVSLETFNAIAKKINDRSDAELLRISRILESTALIAERTERMLAQADINGTGPLGDINGTLQNIRMISDEIRQGRGNVGQAIYDDQLYNSFLSTMQGLEVTVDKLQDTLDTINSAAQGAATVIDNANVIVEKAVGLGVELDTSASYLISSNQAQAGASLRLTPESNDRWYRVGVSSMPNG